MSSHFSVVMQPHVKMRSDLLHLLHPGIEPLSHSMLICQSTTGMLLCCRARPRTCFQFLVCSS